MQKTHGLHASPKIKNSYHARVSKNFAQTSLKFCICTGIEKFCRPTFPHDSAKARGGEEQKNLFLYSVLAQDRWYETQNPGAPARKEKLAKAHDKKHECFCDKAINHEVLLPWNHPLSPTVSRKPNELENKQILPGRTKRSLTEESRKTLEGENTNKKTPEVGYSRR